MQNARNRNKTVEPNLAILWHMGAARNALNCTAVLSNKASTMARIQCISHVLLCHLPHTPFFCPCGLGGPQPYGLRARVGHRQPYGVGEPRRHTRPSYPAPHQSRSVAGRRSMALKQSANTPVRRRVHHDAGGGWRPPVISHLSSSPITACSYQCTAT